MAHVVMTRGLRNQIENSLMRMQYKEQQSEPEPPRPTLSVSQHEFLRRPLWGPLFGTKWEGEPRLVGSVGFTAEILFGELVTAGLYNHDSTLTLQLNEVPLLGYVTELGHSRRNFGLRGDRADHPYFEKWVQWSLSKHEISTRWQGIQRSIVGFIGAVSSLNEALKLWPDIANYVDSDYMDRVRAPSTKNKKDVSDAIEALSCIDKDTVTSSTVLARMVSAGRGE